MNALGTMNLLGMLAVGMFFSCCGWNKLFDERRSASMRYVMAKYLPWPDHRVWYWFVSTSELVLGIIMLFPILNFVLPDDVHIWTIAAQKLAAAGLYIVCAVAFYLVGFSQVKNDYQPGGVLDWTSSLLYKTEILLMIICLMVIAAPV